MYGTRFRFRVREDAAHHCNLCSIRLVHSGISRYGGWENGDRLLARSGAWATTVVVNRGTVRTVRRFPVCLSFGQENLRFLQQATFGGDLVENSSLENATVLQPTVARGSVDG